MKQPAHRLRSVEIDGSLPDLAGKVCQALFCWEYWYRGKLDEPAGTIYARFDDVWHRLYFDWHMLYCRVESEFEGIVECTEAVNDGEIRYIDLGERFKLNGKRVVSLTTEADDLSSRLVLSFEGGGSLIFSCVGDSTNCTMKLGA